MGIEGVNVVALCGNLTRDPELRTTSGGTSVCSLRVAVNERYKNPEGEWDDRPNYFSITVWGTQGENCARYLEKGRGVVVSGRLQWREWQDKDTGKKREAVDIVAQRVQFMSGRRDDGDGEPQVPVDSDFAPATASSPDDDIPF